MIDDAIADLLNMVAGQIQTELEIDQPLGLPRPTTLAELSQGGGVAFEDSILLTSDNLGDLKLWIFERTAPVEGPGPARYRQRVLVAVQEAGAYTANPIVAMTDQPRTQFRRLALRFLNDRRAEIL